MSDVMDINKENIVNGAATVKQKKTVSKRKAAQFFAGLPSTIVHDGFPFTRKKVKVDASILLVKYKLSGPGYTVD